MPAAPPPFDRFFLQLHTILWHFPQRVPTFRFWGSRGLASAVAAACVADVARAAPPPIANPVPEPEPNPDGVLATGSDCGGRLCAVGPGSNLLRSFCCVTAKNSRTDGCCLCGCAASVCAGLNSGLAAAADAQNAGSGTNTHATGM